LEGVSINKDLTNTGALAVNILNLFWSNVLTLAEFEDVLRSIEDLDGSIVKHHSDISAVNPTFFIKEFLGLFRIMEISLNDC